MLVDQGRTVCRGVEPRIKLGLEQLHQAGGDLSVFVQCGGDVGLRVGGAVLTQIT